MDDPMKHAQDMMQNTFSRAFDRVEASLDADRRNADEKWSHANEMFYNAEGKFRYPGLQSPADCKTLSDEFWKIAEMYREIPSVMGSFDSLKETGIKKCEDYRRKCEEKRETFK